MRQTLCDKCGKVIIILRETVTLKSGNEFYGHFWKIADLCESCEGLFSKWLKEKI